MRVCAELRGCAQRRRRARVDASRVGPSLRTRELGREIALVESGYAPRVTKSSKTSASTTLDPGELRDAIRANDAARVDQLLDAGIGLELARCAIRTTTSDEILARLLAAGVDLNADEPLSVAFMLGNEGPLPTGVWIMHLRRLIGHGYEFGTEEVKDMLAALHPGVAAADDIAAAVIELAHARGTLVPDAALMTFALDKLPLAAVQALAAAGARYKPTAKVKAKAPEAKAKIAWLAGAAGATKATTVSWEDFERLEGADLAPDTVVARVVGSTIFPELPPGATFASEIEDDEAPATHELSVGDDGEIRYAIRYYIASSTVVRTSPGGRRCSRRSSRRSARSMASRRVRPSRRSGRSSGVSCGCRLRTAKRIGRT